MGLESAPQSPTLSDPSSLKRPALELQGRLWLVVSVPLEPFSMIMRLPVISYRAGMIRCAFDSPSMHLPAWPMQEMAGLYLSQRYPLDQNLAQDQRILVRKPGASPLEVTLLDEKWPDTVNGVLAVNACHLDKVPSSPGILDFYVSSQTPLESILDQMHLQILALEETPQHLTPSRAS